MNFCEFKAICEFRDDYKEQVEKWAKQAPLLQKLQKEAARLAGVPPYSFETPVVYNRSLDEIMQEDEIRLIVIGDNPGKDEQLAKNNRYLVGQAGKIAEGFFKKNAELGIDFRKNAIILNKTPVHSSKTAQLKVMAKLGGPEIASLLEESQIWCAERTASLHQKLCQAADGIDSGPELWLVGYSELKPKGIFTRYAQELKAVYQNASEWEKVLVFQHFSMNRFTIDLAQFRLQAATQSTQQPSLYESLQELGRLHREEIFNS